MREEDVYEALTSGLEGEAVGRLSEKAEDLQRMLRTLIEKSSFLEKIGLRALHGAISKARARFNF